MSTQKQTKTVKQNKKTASKGKPSPTPKQPKSQASVAELSGGSPTLTATSTATSSTEAQTDQLRDVRFRTMQRRMMASQIANFQGNKHLSDVVQNVKRQDQQEPLQQFSVQPPVPIQRQEPAPQDSGSQTVTGDTIYIINNINAHIRTDPPQLSSTGGKIALGTRVKIIESYDQKGKIRVKVQPVGLKAEEAKWIDKNSNLTSFGDVVSAGQTWANKQKLGTEAISQLQAKLGVAVTGNYDDKTIGAVIDQRIAWGEKVKIKTLACPTQRTFSRLGLIFTNKITAATVEDDAFNQIKTLYPDGVTVALYADYAKTGNAKKDGNNKEFPNQAKKFASNQNTLGLSAGQIAMGQPIAIKELGDVIEAVQSVHRGLLARYQQQNSSEAQSGTNIVQQAIPAYTKVKNITLFAHGMPYGMALNKESSYSQGLHSTQRGLYPANVEAFVKGLAEATTPDIRVQLFACSAARGTDESVSWLEHTQDKRMGEKSLAADLAEKLGDDASTYSHTTAGHTTENYAARVFGKDSGEGAGGLHLFDLMYDDAFIKSEVTRLFPDKKLDEKSAEYAILYKSVREKMWKHYRDSISNEHNRKSKDKRYETPIGQEIFINPANAKILLHTDWTTWVTTNKPAG